MTSARERGDPLLKLPLELLTPVRVQAQDLITTCLKRMRDEAKPTAIALDDAGRFEGLFTERDYFLKGHLIERLLTKRAEIRVSACMDKTVIPVAAQDIHLAHNYMLRTGRRYLPIAASREDLRNIIGVLSLDELVRFYIANPIGSKSTSSLSGRKQVFLGVVSRDSVLNYQFETISGGREQSPRVRIRKVDMGDVVSDRQIRLIGESYDGILLDVRSLQPKKWGKLAYSWFKSGHPKRIGILSRAERVGKVSRALLTHMDAHPAFHFLPRPRNMLEVAKTTLDFLRVF